MSKKRLLSSPAAICGALVITARFATLYFPIIAPAQEVVPHRLRPSQWINLPIPAAASARRAPRVPARLFQ